MSDISCANLYHDRSILRWSALIERALDHNPVGAGDFPHAGSYSAPPGGDGGLALASRQGSAPETPHGALPACADPAGAPPDPAPNPAIMSGAPLPISARIAIAAGPIDRASIQAAVLGGAAYLALAWLSLLSSRADDTASLIWLPNACAVAFLLRARIGNEIPFLIASLAGSLGGYAIAQVPGHVSLVFSLANVAEIIVVLALTRTATRLQPDMSRLPDLARFVWAGGLIGPLLSAILTAPVMGADWADMRTEATAWFLTNSMAMVLIVPTALLVVDRIRGQLAPAPAHWTESAALLVGGMTCAFLVFNNPHYSLMFLIQPITLLHAFRIGSLGSALHLGAVALVAAVMTWAGFGPIAAASGSNIAQLHLLQAFIAANFLTGLPVAAILAGRDRIKAELEAGKQQVDLLADNITDAILRFDLDGVCTYASPSVREVMGAGPATFVGNHVSARLHPDTRDAAMQAFARLRGGVSAKERVTYRRLLDQPGGKAVFLEADCAVVINALTGMRESVVVAARDVTERVELEHLLTRARRHAENAAQVKSDFLANMSHEIRTPMNGVLGFAELMLQGDLQADQRRFAEMIVQSGRSMMMLLNDVLDLSKIESGQFAIDCAPVDLHASLAECAALHRAAAEQKGLTIAFKSHGGPDNGPWVITDGLRLRQIMLNLIGNAVKFTQAGQITVTSTVTPDDVQVTVTDSGIGISPDRLETIFHPFTQGEASTARRFGGTGLGLSISRQLAALLGGRITVDSVVGQGSRFTLSLPAAVVPPPAANAPDEPVGPGALFAPLSAPLSAAFPCASRILLVEDHDINRLLVTEMLERCGQDVAVAHDGTEGIAMVIDSIMRGRPYDLVLMDLQMPDCDGYEATRAIRAEGIGPGLLPIIALTANAYPEDVAAVQAAGMQAHLAKPVAFDKLARTLQRWLPTRIVEAPRDNTGASDIVPQNRAAALALSPQLVQRWLVRRGEAADAVRAALLNGALGEGVLDGEQDCAGDTADLARIIHKLAGTAALFGEPEMGQTAAALERALLRGGGRDTCRTLAQRLLALADGAQ